MSVRRSDRCVATAKSGTRCKNRTAKSDLCWIHLKAKYHVRIKKSEIPRAGLGLFATEPFRKGATVPYTGPIVVNLPPNESHPYALQIRKHPPTFINPTYTNDRFGQYANSCTTASRRAGHCTGNNAQLRPAPGLKANVKFSRNVGKDKEIYVAYGGQYWRYHQ